MARTAATDPLAGRIALGIIAQVIGFALALPASSDDGTAVIGWALVGLGSIVVSIGVIGWGVLAGLRAHEREKNGS